ncbi:MAG: NAD(P)/FAD-dependent oxidoreductase [Nitrospirota bacterium]|nr:NAD(P)/FAD-dependent oxidoreductase [Nitrospirota bacterium]
MPDIQTDVVVVGAGGGGAILGLLLAKKGIPSLVLEQAPGPPQGIRGEILQPNGQRVLDQLGLLEELPKDAVQPVQFFHFRKIGGDRLCTIDYDALPPPYNRALVTLPHTVHRTVLASLQKENSKGLLYESTFKNVIRTGERISGIEANIKGEPVRISAKLVVGADGPFSKVREAVGIPTRLHRYPESYVVAILDCPETLDDAQYFLGRKEILGLFPAAGNKVYLVYMVESKSMDAIKKAGLSVLQDRWTGIYPKLAGTFAQLTSWDQTAYMPTGRARAKTWVANGVVIIGDAAHGMNPHASQGRMQAMVDAVALADIIPSCLNREDCSAQALKAYEIQRRPQVEMLQRLADEEVIFWNTGNPILAWMRDRVFSTIDGNPRLKYQVLTATAGLRTSPPFGLLDRIQATGFIPDPRANHIPSKALLVL